jgi:hypothetical protein
MTIRETRRIPVAFISQIDALFFRGQFLDGWVLDYLEDGFR